MKKFLLLITLIILTTISWGQCSVTATSTLSPIVCGQCVDLNAVGTQGTLVMNNDFNTGVAGPGWSTTSAADFSNPCGPGPGATYMWMGATSPAPRTLTTNNFDMSCGGQVCFDFRMEEQGGASPCEGPDLATEGIYFQYSTNGGATWTTINYFQPNPGGAAGTVTNWNNYCFTLPAGAWTTATMFQWTQSATSSNLNDHWGIDNVTILANDCNYYYDWSHIAGSPDVAFGGTVCPTSTTTYNVLYTNGINDTCTSSVTVSVLFPDVDVTATVNPIITCGGCTQLDATLTSIPPDSCCFTLDMDDSFGDGWNGASITVNIAGGGSLGPFTATGFGSLATFCVVDGATFTLNYTAGTWESEVTYSLLDPSATPIFIDGTNPSTGNVFTTLVDCGTPPPTYTWTWIGPSLTAINDSTQTACPIVDSWYYVEVSDICITTDSVFIVVDALPDSTITDVDLCSGQNYTFPDGTTQVGITVNTTQYSDLLNMSGCDSVVTTNITILSTINVTVNDVICNGDDYTFPDGFIEVGVIAPVSHISNLMTSNGCDSVITTNVTPNPTYNIVENFSVCDGDPYTFPDGTVIGSITTPTTHVSNLTTMNSCDSTITTNITPNPVYDLVEDIVVCDGSDYTFPDGFVETNITVPTTHISNLLTTNGCDSIITTSVDVIATYTSTTDEVICSGDDYIFADGSVQTNITGPTSYTSTLTSVGSCDSLVTENITVNPVYNLVENFDQCPGLNFTFPDGTSQSNILTDMSYVSNLTTTNGCDSIITTNVNIYDVPAFDVVFSPNGCPPHNLVITNNTVGTDCEWTVSGPGWLQTYTGCGPISETYYNSGTYDVSLTMNSVDGCPMSTTITNAFEIYPEPVASFTWDPNEGTVINNTIYFNNNSIGATNYTWSFGDGTSSTGYHDSHTYLDSGNFVVSLIVENTYGCSDTAYGTVIINEEFFLFVPNTFTPDGDIHNNTFDPIVSGHDPQRYTLYIFNRWGEILFESHDSNVGWDGTYGDKGLVQDGVYVWQIEVWTLEGNGKDYRGHVTVLK